MRKLGLFVLFLFTSSVTWAAEYHVDNVSGSDKNSGTEAAPWKSLNKVNGTALNPGDSVLFKRGGSWTAGLVPSSSGSSGIYVSYGAYGAGNRPVIRNAIIDGRAYLKFQELKFSSTGAENAVLISKSHHISLDHCEMVNEALSTGWAALNIGVNSHHNTVRNCTIERRATASSGDAVTLTNNANYNLIDGNSIGKATHYALNLEGYNVSYPTDQCNFNVIRRNVINNPYGGGVEVISNSNHNLVELNDISGGGIHEKAPHMLKLLGRGNIVRLNILHDNPQPTGYGLSLMPYQGVLDPMVNVAIGNRVYNNTIVRVHSTGIFIENTVPEKTRVAANRFKNNLVAETGVSDGYQVSISSSNIGENAIEGNLLFKSGLINVVRNAGVPYSVPGIQRANLYWSNNLQADPLLDSRFHPRPGSPAIDRGVYLAKIDTLNSREGAEASGFIVDDAGWFFDGFGFMNGDKIRIGKHITMITDVDTASGKISVTPPVPCKTGDAISLPYSGARPDIGAFELGSK